jgi:hypothetical protein
MHQSEDVMSIENETFDSAQFNREKYIPNKGERLNCETCGLSVIIDEVSSSVAFSELVCCGKPMKLNTLPSKKGPIGIKTRGRQAGSSRYQG